MSSMVCFLLGFWGFAVALVNLSSLIFEMMAKKWNMNILLLRLDSLWIL